MAFWGFVKPERWNRILNPIDDVSRFFVSWAIGEKAFNYDFTQPTNSSVIGSFIGCLDRANIGSGEIIRLYHNIFYPTQLEGLENVVLSIDQKLKNFLPEVYRAHPLGSLTLAIFSRRPSLYIQDNIQFHSTWKKMEASVNFLLCQRGIIEDQRKSGQCTSSKCSRPTLNQVWLMMISTNWSSFFPIC